MFVRRIQRLLNGYFLWMTSEMLKEAEYGSHVEEVAEKTLILMSPHHFLIMYLLGCTQRECKANETIIDENRKMFESRFLSGAIEHRVEKTSRTNSAVVIRYRMTCSKVRWKIVYLANEKDRAVAPSPNSLLGRPLFQEESTGIVEHMQAIRLRMLFIWLRLVDLTFFALRTNLIEQ